MNYVLAMLAQPIYSKEEHVKIVQENYALPKVKKYEIVFMAVELEDTS